MAAAGIDWTDLRTFGALLRTGSLAAAARELRVDATTVGRRVTALERVIGVPLVRVERGRRVATEAGAIVAEAAEDVTRRLVDVAHALDAARGEARGGVRLTTTEILATAILAPALPALRRAHPGITLTIDTSPGVLDLARGEADLALRFVAPAEAGVVRRRLGAIPTSAWASAAHLRAARRGGRLDPAALAIVSYGAGGRPESEWLAAQLPGASVALRTGSVGVALEAVAAGVGVGVLPDRSAAERSLVKVTQLGAPPERTLWLVLEPRAAKVPRIRAVAEWVAGAVRAAR